MTKTLLCENYFKSSLYIVFINLKLVFCVKYIPLSFVNDILYYIFVSEIYWISTLRQAY